MSFETTPDKSRYTILEPGTSSTLTRDETRRGIGMGTDQTQLPNTSLNQRPPLSSIVYSPNQFINVGLAAR
jgi:hypothetical protein